MCKSLSSVVVFAFLWKSYVSAFPLTGVWLWITFKAKISFLFKPVHISTINYLSDKAFLCFQPRNCLPNVIHKSPPDFHFVYTFSWFTLRCIHAKRQWQSTFPAPSHFLALFCFSHSVPKLITRKKVSRESPRETSAGSLIETTFELIKISVLKVSAWMPRNVNSLAILDVKQQHFVSMFEQHFLSSQILCVAVEAAFAVSMQKQSSSNISFMVSTFFIPFDIPSEPAPQFKVFISGGCEGSFDSPSASCTTTIRLFDFSLFV